MADIQFKLYVDNQSASRELLDRVEEITVEQEVDMAWEARIQIPFCLDEKGRWIGENEKFKKPFSRMRVEVTTGNNSFVPLIDGPIVESSPSLSHDPGQSSITITIQDDSVYLNRQAKIEHFENSLDHNIVEKLFEDVKQITSVDIQEISARSVPVVQRCTNMELMRRLAKSHERMHAYVLPGDKREQSIGVFKSFPTQPDGLAPLILLGPDRNLKSFDVQNDALMPSAASTCILNIRDKTIISSTANLNDRKILGDVPAVEEKNAAGQILSPYDYRLEHSENAVRAKVDDSSYGVEVTGSVLEGCYDGVLRPYRVITVKAGKTELSGNYQIVQVTHTLTRSNYSQSFKLRRDALSSNPVVGSGAESQDLKGSIF